MKKNNFLYGFLISLISIIATFFIIYCTVIYTSAFAIAQKLYLLSAIPALLIMRWFFVNKKLDKSAKGALIAIFLSIIFYFIAKNLKLLPFMY